MMQYSILSQEHWFHRGRLYHLQELIPDISILYFQFTYDVKTC